MPKDKEQNATAKEHSPSAYDPNDIQALRDEIQVLRQFVRNVAEANAIENVIINGFSTLATQLQPLREMAPPRTPLRRDGEQALHTIRKALARPQWKNEKFEIHADDEQPQTYQSRSISP
jgi:hypothetical protein